MAQLHLKSGAGNVSPYVDWTNAATTLAAAITAMAAGDTLAVSSAHAEASAGITATVPGTTAAVTKILGGTQGASSGLTALATGGVIQSTTATMAINGSFYAANITWRASSASSVTPGFAQTSGNGQTHENCRFEITGTSAISQFRFGATAAAGGSCINLINPVFKYANAGQTAAFDGNASVSGGSIDPAGSAITGIFKLSHNSRGARVTIDDFDASAAAASANVVGSLSQGGCYFRARRMKLPASWTGALVASGQLKIGDRYEMFDFSSGTTKYKAYIQDFAGTLRDENTVKVTANTHSYKAVTTADCGKVQPFRGVEYFASLASGSAQTITLDVLTDGVTLTDAEAWLEVDYFAGSTSIGTTATDAVADALATPANQTTSSATWTTTGITTPVKQSLSVTVTPGAADYAIVRAVFAKPSTTVYIDDRLTVA